MTKEIPAAQKFPAFQTAAVVGKLGGPVEIRDDYPTPKPGVNEILTKVLYTGVCQSGESHGTLLNVILMPWLTCDPIQQIFTPNAALRQVPMVLPSQK